MLLTHVVYLVFQACVALFVHFILKDGRASVVWSSAAKLPIWVRITWFTQIICIPGGFMVTILFWTLLVTPVRTFFCQEHAWALTTLRRVQGQKVGIINYFIHATVWAVCCLECARALCS